MLWYDCTIKNRLEEKTVDIDESRLARTVSENYLNNPVKKTYFKHFGKASYLLEHGFEDLILESRSKPPVY